MRKIALCIAGSDTSGGAGIQADLKTFANLGVHGCSVVTAITAQNNSNVSYVEYLSRDSIQHQLNVLRDDLLPDAIKIGMIGSEQGIDALIHSRSLVANSACYDEAIQRNIVLDPILLSSSGKRLYQPPLSSYLDKLKKLFPLVTLITPNIPEAEMLLGRNIHSHNDIKSAAEEFLTLGVKSVLVKGGHSQDNFCHDYWTNGSENFWVSSPRQHSGNYRGTGCILSSAITASLALGYNIKDALVIAKMYVNQSIASTQTLGWPELQDNLPYLADQPIESIPEAFPKIDVDTLKLYPVVDSYEWIKKLLPSGVRTLQLRIKNKVGNELENEIKASVKLAKEFNAQLFINDHWELAAKHNAYGVHLGQSDLDKVNLAECRNSGLRLGVSTHCYHEVARAHAVNPSYIACGPIFHTTSKIMPFAPQGIAKLNRWRKTLLYPLVAIGGINADNIESVLETKADGIAMISAITHAENPFEATCELMEAVYPNAT